MQDQPHAVLGSPDSGAKSSCFQSPCVGRTGTLMCYMMLHVYVVCLQCIHGIHELFFYVCYVSYLPNCHGWSWGLGKTFWWASDSSIGRYFLAEAMMKWSFNKIIIKDIRDALRKCQPLLKCWWSDDFALLGRYLKKSWQIKGLWLIVHTFTYPCCMN